MLSESKRRNETDRFYRLEQDNNSQLHSRIKTANRELAAEKHNLDQLDQQCTNLTSEVPTYTHLLHTLTS